VIQPTCPAGIHPMEGRSAACRRHRRLLSPRSAPTQSLIYSLSGWKCGGYEWRIGRGSGGNGSDWALASRWMHRTMHGRRNDQFEQLPITADDTALCEPAEIAQRILISVKGNSVADRTPPDITTAAPIPVPGQTQPDRRACCTHLSGGTNVRLMRRSLSMGGQHLCRGSAYPSPGRSRRLVITTIQPRHPRIKPSTGVSVLAFVTSSLRTENRCSTHDVRGHTKHVSNALAVGRGKSYRGYTRDRTCRLLRAPVEHRQVVNAAGPDTICVNGAFNGYVAEFDRQSAPHRGLLDLFECSVSTQGTNLQR